MGCGHGWWPGGLSAHRSPPFPLLLPSLAAYTPAAQSQAVQSWAGGVRGVGLTDTLGGGSTGGRSVEGALGVPIPGFSETKGEVNPLLPYRGGQSRCGGLLGTAFFPLSLWSPIT